MSKVSDSQNQRAVKCKMVIDGEEVVFQIDTGATCNLIPVRLAKNLQNYSGTLTMWNNAVTQPIGKCRRKVVNPKTCKSYNIEFIVCDNTCQPLLGLRASQQMGLIKVLEDQFERVAAVSMEEYKEVFDDKLGMLPGVQTLRVNPEARPVVMANRHVSVNARPALKSELDRLENMRVVSKVSEPTPWLSQLVMTQKKDGSVRVCIDPHELNKVIQREHYTMPVMEDVMHELRESRIFTKADLSCGYWHVKLDDASSMLTTFMTPFGRYRWLRLPFGLAASAEIFQKKLIQALDGLPGVICIADDVVIHGRNKEEHDTHLAGFLKRCKDQGIKLNKKKMEVATTSICFMGHQITSEGLRADPAKVEAIMQLPTPQDLTELRRIFGMVNFVAKFMPNLSVVLQPLHDLLKKDVPFTWTTNQEKAFQRIKTMLSQAPVLAFYDPQKKLTVENDACEYGLGSVLMQGGQPIAYASRSLSETEARYSQIEREMLAVVYGLEKFHHYTYAREVEVVTDHKPLVAISKKPLSKAPRRLQNLLLRARNYRFEINYRPGKDIPTADALSRTPAGEPKKKEVVHSVTTYPIKDKLMQHIRDATATDDVLTTLGETILRGWPENKIQVPTALLPYYHYRDELAVSDGVIMRGERVVIPTSLRREMKRRVHTGHLGINTCLRLARDVMYWPGMSSEVRQHVETCGTCATFSDKQPKESVVITDIPKWPWRKVGVDLFSWGGDDFLITVCYHSNFIEVDELRTASSTEVIKKLKAHFARNGSPEILVSDNGTQFTSAEFKSFQEEWSFQHESISPGNSQANGAAEVAVKTVKRIFRKCSVSGDDPYKALLHFRNTPTEGTNTCPAQRLLGRRTRSMLPTTEARLQPGYVDPVKEQQRKEKKRLITAPEDRADLRPLNVNETVRMQH